MKHRIISKLAVLLPALALAASLSHAAKVENVRFPDVVQDSGKKLTLNGAGLRQATFLNIDVYAAGLYLENKSQDPAQILGSPQTKKLLMVFLREVDAKKIKETWHEGFEKVCSFSCAEIAPQIKQLYAQVSDAKEGDRMLFTFNPNSVEVRMGKKPPVVIQGKKFSHDLLAIWLGSAPPTEDLKESLLGKKAVG